MRNRVQTTAFFFDMVISASASRRGKPPYEGLKPFTAQKVVEHLSQLKKVDRATMRLRSGRLTVYLQDIRIEPDHACLLISVSDQDASDLAFTDPQAKTRRPITKAVKEGLDASAHVVIRMRQDKPDTFRMLVEGAPGLPSSKAQQFLNFCMRTAGSLYPDNFLVEDPEQAMDAKGKVKKIKARMKIQLLGHPSASLRADIDAGTVSSIELMTRNVKSSTWDEEGYVKDTAYALKLDTSEINKQKKSPNFSVLREICVRAVPRKLEDLRVQFKTATGLSRTVLIDTATQTTNDEAYVRKELLHGFAERGGPTCLDKNWRVLSGTLLIMGFAHFPMLPFA
jgi:hypothetical protein